MFKLNYFLPSYPEYEDSWKSVACCARLHIHNVLTKGVQHSSMVKFIWKGEGITSWSKLLFTIVIHGMMFKLKLTGNRL